VENAAAMEIREQNGGLRQLLLDADSHSCLEKPRKQRSAFPHLPQGPVTIHSYEENFHLENYKGWLRIKKISRSSFESADGVVSP
jgi:hypothetical protein